MGKASITIAISSVFNGNGFEKALDSASKLGSKLSRMEKLTAANANSVASNVGQMGLKYEELGRNIETAGKRVANFGDNLTKSVTLPMVTIGAYAGKMAVDFDTALANVRKTSDLTEAQLESLAQSALELSKTQPVDASTILNVEALGAQLGVSNDKLQDFASTVTGLDIATNMDFETAGKQMAQFANITQMSQADFERYGSTIVDLGNNLATTESDISNMALRLAGAGTAAKFSQADILGMSGAMSSLGIKAEAGGSAMTRIIQDISKNVANGSGVVEEYARVAGMSADEFADAWKTRPMEAIEALVEGLKRTSDSGEDMNVTLEKLGINNVRNSDTMRRLANAGDLLRASVDRANGAWEQNTALQNEVDQRNESMASRLQVLKNKIDAIAITVGRPLVDAVIDALEALDPFIQTVANVAQAFADMDEAGQRNILMWAGVVAAAGPVLSVTGRLTQGVGTLVRAFGDTSSKIAVYADAMNSLDGAQLRTYASSKSNASALGLAGNAAVKAAGGVENYVKAWDNMKTSADRVQTTQKRINELMAQAETVNGAAKTSILKKASALESDRIKAEESYKANAKLVTAFSDSTSEAEKAADGIKLLDNALEDVKQGSANNAKVLSDYSKNLKGVDTASKTVGLTLGQTVKNGAMLAAASIKQFVLSCAPMLALTAVVAVIGAISDHFKQMEEHAKLVSGATRSFGDLMVEAGNKASASVSGLAEASRSIKDIKASADEALTGVKELGDSIVDKFANIGAQKTELDGYVETIEKFGNKSGITAGEQAKLKAAIEGYNSITGEQLTLIEDGSNKIQDQSGKLLENTGQLQANADAWQRRAEAAAAQDLLTEAYKNQYEAQQQLTDAQKAHEKKIEDYLKITPGATRAEAEWALRNSESAKAVESANAALDGANEQIDGLTAKTTLAASALSEDFKSAVEQLPPTMQQAGIDMASKLSEGVEAGRVTAAAAVSFLKNDVVSAISTLPAGMQDEGMEVANQLAAGISSGQITVEQASAFLNSGVSGTIANLPPDMQSKGMEAATALATEISNGQISVEQATELLKQAANGGVTSLPTDMSQTATDAVNGLNTAIANGQSGTLSAALKVKDKAKSGVSGLPEDMRKVGTDSTGSLAGALDKGSGGVGKAAGAVAAKAKGMSDVGDMWASGNHLVSNFARGISGSAYLVKNAADGVLAKLNALRFSVPKEGPFSGAEKGGETSGRHLVENFARGMRSGSHALSEASEYLMSGISLGDLALQGSASGAGLTTNNSNTTYVLNINGAQLGSASPRVMEAVEVIFNEFNLTNSMGV